MSEFKPFCSPRRSARGSLAKEMHPSVVAGRRATILQPPSIIAGLPSAVAWSHPTAEGVPSNIASSTRWRMPQGGTLLMDTGFAGYTPPRTDVLMPRKKPKGKPLVAVWKMINRGILRLRVGVEHAITGIKRRHIVADIYRNTKEGFEDAAMLLACGLHNFRASCRSAA